METQKWEHKVLRKDLIPGFHHACGNLPSVFKYLNSLFNILKCLTARLTSEQREREEMLFIFFPVTHSISFVGPTLLRSPACLPREDANSSALCNKWQARKRARERELRILPLGVKWSRRVSELHNSMSGDRCRCSKWVELRDNLHKIRQKEN